MSRLILIATMVWFLHPSHGRAAFVSCEDAHNYGENSGRMYVSQAFARMECDELLLDTVHNAVARMLGTQVLQTSDSPQEKLCYYQGYWDGVVGQVSEEYASCGGEGAFACVDRAALAAHAGGLLRALAGALADSGILDDAALSFVYRMEDELLCEVPLCEPLPVSSCATIIRDRAGPRALARVNALVVGVAESVCE